MMCEMFGKAEGCCNGKGGAMHTGDFSVGALTANAIVGGNIPIAAGVALSFKMRKQDNVIVCFFGDGATNQGSFHETMNAAAIWKLPVVFACENNLYSATTSINLTCNMENPAADRAVAYNIPAEIIDGNDVIAVNEASNRAVKRAREGKGPTIIELKTYRHGGHSRNDACAYRPQEEEEEWFARDPIKMLRDKLLQEEIISEEELLLIEQNVDKEIEDAVDYAINAPFPTLEEAYTDVFS